MSIWNFWRRPTPDPVLDERKFRAFVVQQLLDLGDDTEQIMEGMEILMSASDDFKAAAAAIEARMDAFADLVGTNTTAILAAITAIVAGQNPDGSVPSDVANAVVLDLQAHLTAAEAKVGELVPAVAALDAAVHPAPAAPAAPPA